MTRSNVLTGALGALLLVGAVPEVERGWYRTRLAALSRLVLGAANEVAE